jgi:hypothetical protein
MTYAQNERQRHRRRNGQYDEVFPCYRCGKSAGVDYFSSRYTDTVDEDGRHWGDELLCLCEPCAKHMTPMTGAQCFAEVSRPEWGNLKRGKA